MHDHTPWQKLVERLCDKCAGVTVGEQASIGSGWTNLSERRSVPTSQERKAHARRVRVGIPPVRYGVLMRFEREGQGWKATFTEQGQVLRVCPFLHDYTLEETVRRGRGLGCLEDKQAFESGIRNGLGIAALSLDGEQFAALMQQL